MRLQHVTDGADGEADLANRIRRRSQRSLSENLLCARYFLGAEAPQILHLKWAIGIVTLQF